MNEKQLGALWEDTWSLLEEGRSEEAASIALGALNENEDVAELHYLLGLALLDLDEVAAALPEFQRAVEIGPDWADAHAALGWARFRACRFAEARRSAQRALELDEKLPEGHQLRGLLAEREGKDAEAARAFREASRLDPERYPSPCEVPEGEFLEIARTVVAELDEEIRKVLERTALFVQDVPAEQLLHEADPPLDPQILGLFVGRSLLERSVEDSGTLPNTLYLFRRNLQRLAEDRDELREEIRITMLHEVGHHLGWGEEELERRGLA